MEIRLFEVLECPECAKSTFEILLFTDTETLRCTWDGNGACKMDSGNSVNTKNGIILCSNCRAWYPVKSHIPVMLRRELRDIDKDKQFLETYKNYIPEDLQFIYK
jgi:uncharacterized protein YbaR (Trm112 family)